MYDVIVVHHAIVGSDGSIAICQQLRRGGVTAPIVLLAAEGSTDDLVEALETGADEFIVEPVNVALLAARIRALQRRRRLTLTATTTAQHHMLRGPPD
jgi:DNA-binding response OmpR family regulator